MENDDIISNDEKLANNFNTFFSNTVENLCITGYLTENVITDSDDEQISVIINTFKTHPSIVKINENIQINQCFSFDKMNNEDVETISSEMDVNKPTTYNNIPPKMLVGNKDICSIHMCKIYNDSIYNHIFPNALKNADITPAHKKDETTMKDNYRPISILPPVSKVFERQMYNQIYLFIHKYLSSFLCGFRKGYSAQQCLTVMIESFKKALGNRLLAGAILTDLSKAFDCLKNDLLIAKLNAYGFDNSSLKYILSYLSKRKHRMKVINSYSSWSEIKTGVPQGSILGPLLFNIYLNDIFFFVDNSDITNYADDNTPYATENNIDELPITLKNDTDTLLKWSDDNYFKANDDKCHLLVMNHSDEISLLVGKEPIKGSKSVKLLGITIDNELNFNEHVSNICDKVSQKLHILARVAVFINTDKLKILMKAFIESQFNYCVH